MDIVKLTKRGSNGTFVRSKHNEWTLLNERDVFFMNIFNILQYLATLIRRGEGD
jgi:hypothetical protein